MKILLAGIHGRMGKSLLSELKNNFPNYNYVGGLSRNADHQNEVYETLSTSPDFDVLIDFTSPKSTLEYANFCAKNNKIHIIGTTGFSNEEFKLIENSAKNTPIFYASNFSIGVNVLNETLKRVANKIGHLSEVEITESHHRNKVDAPSGTALTLGKTIAQASGHDFDEVACFSRSGISSARKQNEIGFSVIRAGDIIGEHRVLFSLQNEQLIFEHKAINRQVFAQGALSVVDWLSKQPNGLYSMADFLS